MKSQFSLSPLDFGQSKIFGQLLTFFNCVGVTLLIKKIFKKK